MKKSMLTKPGSINNSVDWGSQRYVGDEFGIYLDAGRNHIRTYVNHNISLYATYYNTVLDKLIRYVFHRIH